MVSANSIFNIFKSFGFYHVTKYIRISAQNLWKREFSSLTQFLFCFFLPLPDGTLKTNRFHRVNHVKSHRAAATTSNALKFDFCEIMCDMPDFNSDFQYIQFAPFSSNREKNCIFVDFKCVSGVCNSLGNEMERNRWE